MEKIVCKINNAISNKNKRIIKNEAAYPDNELKRTQDLKSAYFDCGQFYWGTKENWLNSEKIHSNSVGYIIPNWRVVDLDTEEDWKRAELLKKIIK